MKTFAILILLLSLISCRSYLDTNTQIPKYGDKEFELLYYNNYNTLKVLSRLPGVADNQKFYHQKFSINIPKKIVKWAIYNTKYIIEYDNKQIIVIDPGHIEKSTKLSEWTLKEIDNEKILSYLRDYFEDSNYSISKIKKNNNERKTVMYTDGKTEILFFNLKEKNLSNFLNSIKSFEYRG